MDNYEDLINLDYEKIKSTRHPRMSREDRAAQFAPFAALTGHEDAIEETANKHKPDETEHEEFYD